MFLHRKKWFIFSSVVFFVSYVNITASVVADFIVDKSAGCPILEVKIVNKSSGSGTLSYVWNFGAGQGAFSSSADTLKAVYDQPGTYTITLQVQSSTGHKDTKTQNIVVYRPPKAHFAINTRLACRPYTITFTDSSEAGDAPLTNYFWDFRDNTSDTLAVVNKIYSLVGVFDIYHEVMDANGCKSHISKEDYIRITSQPVVALQADKSFTGCDYPYTLDFSHSVIADTSHHFNYEWNFGNGDTSHAKDPLPVMYDSVGLYAVTLKVQNSYGCYAVGSTLVSVDKVKADFTMNQEGNFFVHGDTVCAGMVTVTNTSGINSNMWNIGGTVYYNFPAITRIFNPGSHTVTFVVFRNACRDTMIKNFYIQPVTADFTMDTSYTCKLPFKIKVTDNSVNAAEWLWEYTGLISINPNPDTIIIQKNFLLDTFAHNLIERSIPVKLTITSKHGCKANITKNAMARFPVARFMPDKTFGCVPLTVSFSDSSRSLEKKVKWTWFPGDGTSFSGTDSSLLHTYANPGVYHAWLIMENEKGCIDTSYRVRIEAGSILTPDFTVEQPTICANDKLTFTSLPFTLWDSVDSYHFYSDAVLATVCDVSSMQTVNTNSRVSGCFNATLRVGFNGCFSETTKTNAFCINSPVASFSYSFDCDSSYVYTFNASVHDSYDQIVWLYGDGQADTNILNSSHTYDSSGNYKVQFIVSYDTCSYSVFHTIKVRKPLAVITADTVACVADTVLFSSALSRDIFDSCFIEGYLWYINDGRQPIRTFTTEIKRVFADKGKYTITLVAMAENGCSDTAYHTISVFKPQASFVSSDSIGCSPYTIFRFINTLTDSTVQSWYWKFENDTHWMDTTILDTFRINSDTKYYPTLIVYDRYGCSDTMTKIYNGYKPIAGFMTDDVTLCKGNAIVIISTQYLGADSLLWKVNDSLITTYNDSLYYTFAKRGVYDVSLIVYKSICRDTFESLGYIQVQEADASYAVAIQDDPNHNVTIPLTADAMKDTLFNCFPHRVKFRYLHRADDPVQAVWQFRNGNPGLWIGDTALFIYDWPNTYNTHLAIETSFGCKDTARGSITLVGPKVEWTINPHEACKGDTFNLMLTDFFDIDAFEWYFDDGTTSKDTATVHTYSGMGKHYIRMLLKNNTCETIVRIDSVSVFTDSASFFFPEFVICRYSPITITDNSFNVLSRTWDMGDGSSLITTPNPTDYAYDSVGMFHVFLYTVGVHGCKDTASAFVTIRDLPVVILPAMDTVCLGDGTHIVLQTNPNNKIIWSPQYRIDTSDLLNVYVSPEQSTTYKVVVTDFVGCVNSDSTYVRVIPAPNPQHMPADTTIIIGQYVTLSAQSNYDSKYTWSSSGTIECSNCPKITVQPMDTTIYTVVVSDLLNCFIPITNDYIVNVRKEYSVHLPSAFTPNGDGINDIAYVRGWGIKELIECTIYNRWGNLVFHTNDLQMGWDGTYKGVLQPADSYLYFIKAISYENEELVTQGTITLLK